MPEIDKIRLGNVTYDIGGSTSNGMYITVNGNTAPQAISSGKYIYVQNNASLEKGVYRTTANIASGGAVNLTNTTMDAEGAINNLADNRIDLDVTILTTDWSPSEPYTYLWTNSHVLDECGIGVEFLEGVVEDELVYIGYEKVSGGVLFTAPTIPTHGIPVRIHIYNTLASSITAVTGDMVSTSEVPNASNVDQALANHESRIASNTSVSTQNSYDIEDIQEDIEDIQEAIDATQTDISGLQTGLTNVVNGDSTAEAIPSGAYAYLKNNTHGLTDGYYQNSSANAFPASGGTADSTVFTAVGTEGILNSLNNNIGIKLEYISSRSGSGDITIANMSDYKLFICTGTGYNWIGSIVIPNDSYFNASDQYVAVAQTAANYLFFVKKKDATTITFTCQSNVATVRVYGIK